MTNKTFVVPYLLVRAAACWPAAFVSQRMKSCRLQRSLQRWKGKEGEEHWCHDTTYLLAVPSWLVNRLKSRGQNNDKTMDTIPTEQHICESSQNLTH